MDIGASVLTKLRNKAKETGKPLQLYLQLLCQEEFLRRLSLSKYVDNFILKGGLFIYVLTNFESRATIDVDFLVRRLSGAIDVIKKAIDEIIDVNTGNDFIVLKAEKYDKISPLRKYNGISFKLKGQIKNTITPFNVDIGIGDVVIPGVRKMEVATQLAGFTKPQIGTYSIESTIAEKLEAIIQRLELTSRMKDFYDIYYLAHQFNFDGEELKSAIQNTLKTRETACSADSLSKILAFDKNLSMKKMWELFLKQLKVDSLNFEEMIDFVGIFLTPIWDGIFKESKLKIKWNGEKQEWCDARE
ncbi:MAG: nucleotidyl transferase AbiEii/AbiGii toxin family protein [Bacteroidales bacterium]|jgi:predicted nucleotidyltransferase component of viral defense system|nr:nucleotidyl transferase AbiEii/AbiGii toxin family protein [Bacteroidales bacterium]